MSKFFNAFKYLIENKKLKNTLIISLLILNSLMIIQALVNSIASRQVLQDIEYCKDKNKSVKINYFSAECVEPY